MVRECSSFEERKLKVSERYEENYSVNYICTMSDLYDENADMRIPLAVDVAVCMDNYKRIVLSPNTVWATWCMEPYIDDMQGLGECTWSKAIWRFLIKLLDEFQLKLLGLVNKVQLNTCVILL